MQSIPTQQCRAFLVVYWSPVCTSMEKNSMTIFTKATGYDNNINTTQKHFVMDLLKLQTVYYRCYLLLNLKIKCYKFQTDRLVQCCYIKFFCPPYNKLHSLSTKYLYYLYNKLHRYFHQHRVFFKIQTTTNIQKVTIFHWQNSICSSLIKIKKFVLT